ncbi:hypothetical protein IV500_04205 [Paeniglutamicibacter antarcticus]|uniref:Uncharacterized protein n=1 Tax=Arthrobacter terrae TaxID=2935737 RepID=A0A931CS21_9MICC|nr:hypothetical protein [Arthrobacter terrae]MBG0738623.1 hypothetical protein [Arthrobacter terrae]
MDTSLPSITSTAANDAERIFVALARCLNLFSKPINAEMRARVFNFLETPTKENWEDCRTILVGIHQTLWQAVIATGAPAYTVPSPEDVLTALENSIVVPV